MSKQSANRILFAFLLAGALLFALSLRSSPASEEQVCREIPAKPNSGNTQLLWESLSHQFLSAVQQ